MSIIKKFFENFILNMAISLLIIATLYYMIGLSLMSITWMLGLSLFVSAVFAVMAGETE